MSNSEFFRGANNFSMNGSNINNIAGDHHVTVSNDNRSIADSYNTYNTTNTNSNNTTHHTNTNSGNYTYNTNTNSGNTTYNTHSNSGNTYHTNTNSGNTHYTNTSSGNTYTTNTNSNNAIRDTNTYRDHRTGNTVSDYHHAQRSDNSQNYPPVRRDQPTVRPSLPLSQTQYRSGAYVERGGEYVNYGNTGRVGGEHNSNTNSAYYEEEEVDEGMSQPPPPHLPYGNAHPRAPVPYPGGFRCDPNLSQSSTSTRTGERSSEYPRNRYPNNYSGGSQRRDPPHPRSSQDVPPPYPYAPPLSHSVSESYYQPSQTAQTSPPPRPPASVPPTDHYSSRNQYYSQNASEQGSRPRYSGGSQSGSRSGSMSSKDSYYK